MLEDNGEFGMILTLASACVGAGAVVLAAWRHGRPPDPLRGPRLIPWVWVMLIGATWVLVMLVHALNLLGIHTGRTGY